MTATSAFVFPRDRLFARLDGALRAPLALVVASEGSGKSTAVREYLATRAISSVWVDVGAAAGDPAAFVYALAAAFGDRVPAMRSSAASATQRLAGVEGHTAVVDWVREHLGTLEMTIVLDNIHALDDSPALVPLVRDLIEATLAHLRWILIGSSAAALPVAGWLANRLSELPIQDDDLQVDLDELRASLDGTGIELAQPALAKLLETTGGRPLGLAVALTNRRFDEKLSTDQLYDELVDVALERFEGAERGS
ncbi:MAG TPA: AAA family ATPase, partial [Candidatus Elarobacter sp.]